MTLIADSSIHLYFLFVGVCLLGKSALVVMLLAQVFLKAGEFVHDISVEQCNAIQCTHCALAQGGQQERHEAHKDQEYEAARASVQEAEIHRNQPRHSLKTTTKQQNSQPN